MSEIKKPLTAIFRHSVETREGKYLVRRRDGTIPEWPWFVLGARDPMVPWTLRFYAVLGFVMGQLKWGYACSLWQFAREMREYRRTHGNGDPGMGRHRVDDPATIAEMRKGGGA